MLSPPRGSAFRGRGLQTFVQTLSIRAPLQSRLCTHAAAHRPQVAAATGLRHVNVGDLVKREQLHNGWDDEFECLVIDEDKVGWG